MYIGSQQEGSSRKHESGNATFAEFGVSIKFRKECTNSVATARIPGVHVQHEVDEDISSNNKNQQTNGTNQASSETNHSTLMQVVCQSHGKNDLDDSSNRRGVIAYKLLTEGFSEDSTSTSAKLGITDDTFSRQPEGTTMVDHMDYDQEWITDSDSSINTTSGYSCRRLRFRMGSGFRSRQSNWTLDTSINARELKAILFALRLHANQFKNSTIKIFTDNMTALKYSARSGGTASHVLQDLAISIQDICNEYNLEVEYQHIPGKENIQADQLSRYKHTTNLLHEASMPTTIFNQLNQMWRPLKIDAFETRTNTKLPIFWSILPDPDATANDAFQQI